MLKFGGVNRCYLRKLICGQLNTVPVSLDLVGRGELVFLSAMKFSYSPFPFNVFVRLYRKQIFVKRAYFVSHMFIGVRGLRWKGRRYI